MKKKNPFRINLSDSTASREEQLHSFAILNLGLVQSLSSGVVSAEEALRIFYNAENCLYVKKKLRNREANEVMSRGVQLADLFEMLPVEKASREFFHELEAIRSLCLRLLERQRSSPPTEQTAV